MAKTRKIWRLMAVVSAAAMALAIAASAFAQAPPSPPHTFYGLGGSAMLDGADATGATVQAWDQDGNAIADGTATITAEGWSIDIDPDTVDSVTFTVDGSAPSPSFDVVAGSATEVALDVAAAGDGMEEEPPADGEEPPAGLPNTGTGGIADGNGFPLLPVVLAAALAVALGGVAITRRQLR